MRRLLAPDHSLAALAYATVGVIVLAGVIVFAPPAGKAPAVPWWPSGTELLPVVQGTRLPDALADRPEHVVAGNEPHHDPGQQGAAWRFPASATSAPTSARRSSWTRSSACTSAKTGSASIHSVDYDETLNKIQETVDGYPGIYRDVQTYLKERIREVLTGTHEAITVRIYGRDLDVLRAQGRRSEEAPGRGRRPRRT